MDPIHVAFIQGLGDITPLQDHMPSLACEIIVETAGGPTEVPIRGQEPPMRDSHGVAQALMAASGDLSMESKALSRIQHFGDGLDELLYGRGVFHVAVSQVLQILTPWCQGVRVLLGTKTLIVRQ